MTDGLKRRSRLTLMTRLYAALLGAYLFWTRGGYPRPWWLKGFSPFAFWAFLPSLLLPLLGPRRSRMDQLMGGLAAGLFARHFVAPMIPRRALAPLLPHQATDSPRSDPALYFKVMTSNLLKSNFETNGIVQTIRAELPDVVALQELREQHVEAIERDLAELYPYRKLYVADDAAGMGLLSRHPIQAYALQPAPPGANPTQVARIRIGEQETWVINVHPRNPYLRFCHPAGLSLPCGLESDERRVDVETLVTLIEELSGPAVMMGDFNTSEECEEYRLIPPRWRDAYREVAWGPGFTYPVREAFYGLTPPTPLFRIDYVFYTGGWQALVARTAEMPGSDHRYLVAEFVNGEASNP